MNLPGENHRSPSLDPDFDEQPSLSWVEAVDRKAIERVWCEMRRLKPHLYVVFRRWAQMCSLRDEPTQYRHGLYRGFYAEMGRQLGIDPKSVQYRLRGAQQWFARRLRSAMKER